MAVFNEPTQWEHPLGNNADVATLPDDTSGTSGRASLQKLFQLINQTPLEAGGIAPEREDFNALFKVLGDSIFYAMNGGLWSYNSAFDYPVGRVVLYTDGNLYKCILANDSTDPKDPTDSAYWTKVPTLADFDEIGFKTGDIKIHTTSTVPNGWLLCNGAGVSRTTFSNLFAKIGTTFGRGDDSTTFNIPDLRDRYIIGANTNALGTKVEEQLPNINGDYRLGGVGSTSNVNVSLGWGMISTAYPSGALSAKVGSCNAVSNVPSASYNQAYGLDFNANSSNSIYTDSGKVYPASIALNFIIRT
jgi:microcystin-dependent protein